MMMVVIIIIIIIIMGNTVLYLAENFWTTLGSGFAGFRFTEGPPVYELCSNNASRFDTVVSSSGMRASYS